jgi:hypothetical protein
MCTISSDVPAPSRIWNANAESSPWFQVPTPPESTPHMGMAASKRAGFRWISPAVMMPPSECPQAMVRVGWPMVDSNRSSSAIWSCSAS